MSDVTKALALLATESWNTEDGGASRDEWRRLAGNAARQHDALVYEANRLRDMLRDIASAHRGEPCDIDSGEEVVESAKRLRDEIKRLRNLGFDSVDREEKLRAENAELRARQAYLDKREPLIQRVIDLATADWDTESNVPAFWKARRALLEWTRENPKP